MQAPEIPVKHLKDSCPKCGDRLYAYWHTSSVPGYPESREWHVECKLANCDYVAPRRFFTIEGLARHFQLADQQMAG